MDADTFVRNRSGLRIRAFERSVPVTTNSAGFRYREIPREKPDGVRRFFALGDSTTFGYRVGDDETYSACLEHLIGRRAGTRKPRREVVNAGVIGHATPQGLRHLVKDVLPFAPDAILVSYAMNDNDPVHRQHRFTWNPGYYRVADGRRQEAGPAWKIELRNFIFNNSNLGRWFVWTVTDIRYRLWRRINRDAIKSGRFVLVPAGEYREHLMEFIRIARSRSMAVVFVTSPVQLKQTRYPLYGLTRLGDRSWCGEAAAVALTAVARAKTTEERSSMYYYLGRLYEKLGAKENARKAYLRALEFEEPDVNWRWRALEYSRIMIEVGKREGVPVADSLHAFAGRELGDDPPGLFADQYHPGPLGHEIIADEIYRVLLREGIIGK
jgi:lysophospholipase L1-like esterase